MDSPRQIELAAVDGAVLQLSAEPEKEHFRVPDDCYGDMIMTLVVAVGSSGSSSSSCGPRLLWSLTSFAMYLLNGFLQVGLSFILFSTAVQHSEEKYEHGLPDKVDALRSSLNATLPLDHTMFGELGPETVKMCSSELASIRGFEIVYFMVVFLWYARMTQELSESLWICAVVWTIDPMPKLYQDDDIENLPMLEGAEDGFLRSLSRKAVNGDVSNRPNLLQSRRIWEPGQKHLLPYALTRKLEEQKNKNQVVVRLTPTLRFLIMVLVGIKRIALALWIMWVGAKFLVMSSSTSCLIIKALSLQYLIQIDEMLFLSFASTRRHDEIKRSRLKYKLPGVAWWSIWASSLVRFVFAASMTAITLWGIFGAITDFRSDCYVYFKSFGAPLQHFADWSFF